MTGLLRQKLAAAAFGLIILAPSANAQSEAEAVFKQWFQDLAAWGATDAPLKTTPANPAPFSKMPRAKSGVDR